MVDGDLAGGTGFLLEDDSDLASVARGAFADLGLDSERGPLSASDVGDEETSVFFAHEDAGGEVGILAGAGFGRGEVPRADPGRDALGDGADDFDPFGFEESAFGLDVPVAVAELAAGDGVEEFEAAFVFLAIEEGVVFEAARPC